MQGATAPFISPWPTKLLMFGEDMQSDQLHVPAFFGHSKGPSLEPQPQYYTICCTVVAIWNQFWNLHASEPSSDFRRNHIADSIMFFDLFSPRSCRRRTMGYFGKQSPKHYFGFQHAGQNSMESGYDYVWQFRMPYIVCEKYLMWLFYSSNNLGWFACFRIQFLPDHIMIHSCLVWFPWWLRHGAMEPFEATLFRVGDDCPDCRIYTF